jgi:hypothetical protein
LWGVARFGVAMPAIALGERTVRGALRLSYRRTAGCRAILGLLLLESVGGSYVVYLISRWIWAEAYGHGFTSPWMSWLATSIGLLLGLLIQPHLFVGFALLYLRRTQPSADVLSFSSQPAAAP